MDHPRVGEGIYPRVGDYIFYIGNWIDRHIYPRVGEQWCTNILFYLVLWIDWHIYPRVGELLCALIVFISLKGSTDIFTPELGNRALQIFLLVFRTRDRPPQSWGRYRHIYPRVGESCVTDISFNIPN